VPFWNRSPTPRYSLFYVADLHGSEKCFRKFVNAGKFYRVDALILGGDVTGKALVPLVRLEDGSYEARFLGRTEIARDEKELAILEGQIRFNGFYPFRTDSEELGQLAADPVRREEHFQRVISAAVRQWVALADERLQGTGVACLVMPGNDDGEFVGEILSEGRTLINPEGRTIELGPYQMLSYGWSNITPWKTYRELPEPELGAKIEGMIPPGADMRKMVFNFHCPPYASNLDEAPEIDADLNVKEAGRSLIPVGSTAVRDAIMKHQPLLSLHGHIHEAKGTARLGKTLCINAGSLYEQGVLQGVVVELDAKKGLKSYTLTTG